MNSQNHTPNLQGKAHEGSCKETQTYKFFTEYRTLLPQNKGSLCVVKPAAPTAAQSQEAIGRTKIIHVVRGPVPDLLANAENESRPAQASLEKRLGRLLCVSLRLGAGLFTGVIWKFAGAIALSWLRLGLILGT